jgi:hypothetical protein
MKGRFIAYGLPVSEACSLEAEIKRWEANCGPKWTVDRLKSLKQDFIRIQALQEPLTWVRKNRNGGWFGVWGFLRKYAERSLKCFEIVLNCLMVYSSFIPSQPTAQHIAKMKESVESAKVETPSAICRDISSHAKDIIGTLQLGSPQPLLTFQGKVATKAPVFGGASVNQYDHLELEFKWIEDPYNQLFLNRHYHCYSQVLEGISNLSLREPLRGLSGQSFHLSDFGPFETVHSRLKPPFMAVEAGSLVPLTKDGGWKVRWIASPYRLHQLALVPLGSALFQVLRDLPWDCTFNQSKPYKTVQEHLKRGGTAYAVDLTSATDFFPLDLQVSVLRSLFGPVPDIDLFEELSRCTWKCKKLGFTVQWTNGQPMGLYPSFPAFALTHGVLLHLLSGGAPDRFFVLGDDVVILDENLYGRYIKTLKILGCPHNPDKTIISKGLTEFAGKIITPERIVTAYKWRDVGSNNFLDLMRTFGQRFKPMLRPRENVVYEAVKGFLPPYGCNHSTGLAKPLAQVVYETELFESALPEARGRSVHTSFFHRCAEFLNPRRPGSLFHLICPKWFKKQAARLDERTSTAFENTPFRNLPGDRGVLADILEVSNAQLDLPAVGPNDRVGHQTTLDWYESVLKGITIKR